MGLGFFGVLLGRRNNNKNEDFVEYGGIPEGPASRGFYGAL
jgi:hypothetical protein